MWFWFACGSALFAGLTSILAKCGIKETDSTIATALRTIVVLIFAWIMVLIVGSLNEITSIDSKTFVFLILSGLATGASWLCYFRALQLGSVNKVVPIDKSSIILTVLFAFIFLGESVTYAKLIGLIGIGIGTFLMIERKDVSDVSSSNSWLLYALLSAIFAALTAILGKVGIEEVESNLGTAIRTTVVLVMAWLMVFVEGKRAELSRLNKKELGFILLSGLATGASWLCFYHALQIGPASLVVPIDKLSIVVAIAFSYVVFGERLSRKSALGLLLIVVGTLIMLL
ncbi:MAG: EamA family transporter [Anaerotardibacter sp.]